MGILEGLGFLFGGLFRLAPELIKLWDKKNERQHEIDMIRANREADEARAKLEMEKVETQGRVTMNVEELKAIVAATQTQATNTKLTGNRFLDFLIVSIELISKTVRPFLTYWYCVIAYGSYKTALYMSLIEEGWSWQATITQLWTEQDQAVMLSIIGFWFVDRSIRHFGQKPKA